VRWTDQGITYFHAKPIASKMVTGKN
jgi:hypothetical protein